MAACANSLRRTSCCGRRRSGRPKSPRSSAASGSSRSSPNNSSNGLPNFLSLSRERVRERAVPIYLYIDRGTFVHRLHPTVKVFALFVMFWSVYWVDNPLALLPIGLLMLWIAQLTGSWPNFYRLRWLFAILIFTTTTMWMVFYRKGPALMRVPYRVGFAISLAFRLVPLFIDSAVTIVDAQRLRGYDFNEGGPFERIRRYVPVVVPVF